MPLQYIFTNMFSKLLSAKYGFFLIMPREALLIIWELCCNTANVPHAIHDHMFCTCKDIIILLFGSCLELCKLSNHFIIYLTCFELPPPTPTHPPTHPHTHPHKRKDLWTLLSPQVHAVFLTENIHPNFTILLETIVDCQIGMLFFLLYSLICFWHFISFQVFSLTLSEAHRW